MKARLLLATVVLLAAASVAWHLRRDGAADLPPDVGVVEYVVDGDTIDVTIGGRTERVRLLGIDTPETWVDDGEGDPECYAVEATEYTRRLLPAGTEVRLVRDIVGRDHYDRLLAYVYRRDDGVLVNERLVAAGFARPMTIEPNDALRDSLVAAAIAAEQSGIGLWGVCRR